MSDDVNEEPAHGRTTPSSPPAENPTPHNSVGSSETPTSSGGRRTKGTPRESVKRREICRSKWLRNIAKEKLNAGEEHETPKGLKRDRRILKPTCHDSCRICKSRRLTGPEREHIFQQFWALSDINRKRDFISRHVRESKPKTCSTLPERAKQASRRYFFDVDDVEVKVCKKMFINTLGIPDCWISTSLKKCAAGSVSPDKRGHHANRPNRTRPGTLASVKQHIDSFPRVHSHYTRERTKRQYLETGLTIEKMYRMYCQWAVSVGVAKVASPSLYRKIFNRQYNLGFFLPKKDQCELCNKWKHCANNNERRIILNVWRKHLKNKCDVNKLKAQDKATAGPVKCVACFDLQKVLSCPRSETSLFFYKNKLSLFNFTVFDLHAKEGHCYIWNETEAKKGSDEIASNVYRFIELKVSEGHTEFCFYSDSPTGQNRNRMVFSMYQLACRKFKLKITHRFLESGHSYSEVDSMHACIERAVGRKEVFSPEEWYTLIRNAKQTGESYIVNVITHKDIKDYHNLVKKQSWEENTQGEKVMWSRVREIRFSSVNPDEIFYKYNFDEEAMVCKVTMLPDHAIDLSQYTPPDAYNKKFPLPLNKKKDLQFLLEREAIPTVYHPIYRDLLAIE